MRVYMFHNREFRAPVMSSFFCSHQPFDDITLDDICLYFLLPRYPTDGESDSDTRLTLIVYLDSDPSKSSYPSYHVEFDPSKPSYPLVIRLTSDSSSSSTAPRHVPPLVCGRSSFAPVLFPIGVGMTKEEDVVMMLSVVLRMLPLVRWLTRIAYAEPSMMIALFCW